MCDIRNRHLVTELWALGRYEEAAAAGADLATLLRLRAQGRLTVDIGWRGPWEQVAEAAAEAMRTRRLAGKAVLDVTTAAG